MNAHWGLIRGLHRGLFSGLITTNAGVGGALARGWTPVEALALFATLWASVSVSLQR